ncbi:MAG: hypothetical protein RM021_023300 [Nostoc sp. EkiNYC01]|nr:hypothetical protein [Nostoc sp. EkiNYC01]
MSKDTVDKVSKESVKTAKRVHNTFSKYYVDPDHIHNWKDLLPKEELEKLAKDPELLRNFISQHPNLVQYLDKLRTVAEKAKDTKEAFTQTAFVKATDIPVLKECIGALNVCGTKICDFDNTVAICVHNTTLKVAPQFARQFANAVKVVGPTIVVLDACLMVKDVVKAEEWERREVFFNRCARIVLVGGGVAVLSGVPVAGPIAGSFIGRKVADWLFPPP